MSIDTDLASGQQAFQTGDFATALRHAEAILKQQPSAATGLVLHANAALQLQRPELAIPSLRRLRQLQPAQAVFARVLAQALNRHGSQLRRQQYYTAAHAAFAEAIELDPGQREARFNLATGLQDGARHDLALPHWQRLFELAPDDVEVRLELAATLARLDRIDEARALLVDLVVVDASPLAWRHIEVLLLCDQTGEAVDRLERWPIDASQAKRAIAIADAFARAGALDAARWTLGRVATALGDGRTSPGLRARIAEHLILPGSYADADDVARHRADFAVRLAQLETRLDDAALAPCATGLAQLAWSNFYLAYQGGDDRDLQAGYARLLQRAAARLAPMLPAATPVRVGGSRRVGFASSSFRLCTAGSYFASWPRMLAGLGYDVQVFQLGPVFDAFTDALAMPGVEVHRVSGDGDELARALAAGGCDLLIYPELGMDGRLLPVAALRLAPRQACAWGHPVTTGLTTLDGYFSCAEMEPPDAAEHYVEPLLLLPGLGTDYARPAAPPPLGRAALGLPEGRRLYLLPHSLFKLHPDNDALFAAVAARDPDGLLVMFDGEGPELRVPYRRRIERAMRAAGADPHSQLLSLRMGSRERFLQINAVCDVMVDSLHWSGGNTSLDALASGLPVVTCPGRTMRSRQSAAMLRRLGLDELIAGDAQEQAMLAVEIARDPARRATLSQRIVAGLPRLFDSGGVAEALGWHVERLLARPAVPNPQ